MTDELGAADARGPVGDLPGSTGPVAAAVGPEEAAPAVVARLAEAGQTLAVAESLTGGGSVIRADRSAMSGKVALPDSGRNTPESPWVLQV